MCTRYSAGFFLNNSAVVSRDGACGPGRDRGTVLVLVLHPFLALVTYFSCDLGGFGGFLLLLCFDRLVYGELCYFYPGISFGYIYEGYTKQQ